jgi:histidinol-phosphate/aromatic aminotransferase/cobyric acid decarboxylase-like protein
MTLRLHGDTLADGRVLDFAVNVWPGTRPPGLERALHAALDSSRYPNEERARAAVADRHGRPVDEVLLLNGACEAFWLLAHALRPSEATVVHPSFTEGEAALLAVGATVTRVLRRPPAWTFGPSEVPRDAELVIVGNPNNPTGSVDPPLHAPGLVVIDGSFADFVPFDPDGDIVIRSLTKLWSLAGVRAGYLLAPAQVVEQLAAHRQPWSVNAAACAALEICARDSETPVRVAREVAEAREELTRDVRELGVTVWSSAVNFLLLEVADGPRIVRGLLERGIAVRPCSSFPGLSEHHLRIAVRGPADNRLLVAALRELL